MPNYAYQARDGAGQMRSGELSADSEGDALRALRREGLHLMSLAEAAGSSAASLRIGGGRVSRRDILALTGQLSVMVDAGIPLATALTSIARQTAKPAFQHVLQTIQHDVEGGETLSAALARHDRLFDHTYVNLIKASESSGKLAEMLDRLSAQMQRTAETRQKFLGAMMYPALMMAMCLSSTIFLLTYVFPKVRPLFQLKKIELPWSTKLLMFASDSMTAHWHWILAGTLALIATGWYVGRFEWGRSAYDWLWLRLPILGNLVRKNTLTQCLRTLSTTINSGVPMLESLELCAGVARNVHYRNAWLRVAEEVSGGRQVHEVLADHPLFPPTLVQMIDSGEQTGRLGPVLAKVSQHYDREIETTIKSATSMIEPLMIVLMGSVIGGLALSMLLPIFQLSGHGG